VENSRKAIVESAIHLFAVNGYAETSIREVATTAGVAPALVFHYFDNKLNLLRTCLSAIIESSSERLQHAIASTATQDVVEAVDAYGRAAVTWAVNNRDGLRLLGQILLLENGIRGFDVNFEVGYAMNEASVPLAERLVAEYGERAVMAFTHARVSLLGASLTNIVMMDLFRKVDLRDPDLERAGLDALVVAFREGLFALLDRRR